MKLKALVTGASGFLGRVICEIDKFDIDTCGRSIGMNIQCDLGNEIPVINNNYDIVIHAAGKAHSIPKKKVEEQEFDKVNYIGTINLLKGLERKRIGSFVFISTVAVYGEVLGSKMDESTPLNGSTPYAQSKINAERAVISWGNKHNIPIFILRLPLVVGHNPPGNLGKMIKGIKSGRFFNLAKGKAKRSMVLAEDVAVCIRENIGKSGIYNLTDGYDPSFREISTVISIQLGKRKPLNLPLVIGKLLGRAGDLISNFPVNSSVVRKMSLDLTFSNTKALDELNWEPRRVIDHFDI